MPHYALSDNAMITYFEDLAYMHRGSIPPSSGEFLCLPAVAYTPATSNKKAPKSKVRRFFKGNTYFSFVVFSTGFPSISNTLTFTSLFKSSTYLSNASCVFIRRSCGAASSNLGGLDIRLSTGFKM